MPREFQDFSDEVSQGAGKIRQRLEGVVEAAGKADEASAKLSGTQASGAVRAEQYSRALNGVATSLGSISSASAGTVTGMTAVTRSTDEAGSALLSIGDILSKTIAGALKSFESEKPKEYAFTKGLKGEIDELNGQLLMLEGVKDSKQDYLALNVTVAGKEAVSSFVENELDDFEKGMFQDRVAAIGLDGAVSELTKSKASLAAAIIKAKEAAHESAQQSGTLTGEISEAESAVDLLKMKFQEGAKEAQGFAGGLGANAGAMIGLGVAAVFLVQKLGDLASQFKEAAVAAKKTVVETDAVTHVLGVSGTQFETVRKQLGLTREEAVKFAGDFSDSIHAGIISLDGLADAGTKLRDTFGGDQTERLREMVELLGQIPSLEADLTIGADLDDTALSIFALAKEGKMDVLMDLQAAGLLGGVEMEVSPEQAEALNVAQSSERIQQDIKDSVLENFPQVLFKLGSLTEIASGLGTGIGGTIAALGALKLISGAQIKAQHGTTLEVDKVRAAILGKGGGGGGMGGGKAGLVLAGVAAASLAATVALKTYSSQTEDAGKKVTAERLEMASTAVTAASSLGTLVWLASKIPGVGKLLSRFGSKLKLLLSPIGLVAAAGVAAGASIKLLDRAIVKTYNNVEPLPGLTAKFEGKMKAIVEASDEVEESLGKHRDALIKSGMSLQKALGGIERAANSAKMQLLDLRVEVSKLKLENLSGIGGTAAQFGEAIGTASEDVKKRFATISKSFAEQRAKILQDGKLNARDRAAALDTLSQHEMEAMSKFSEGMTDVIKKMLESPAILEREIKARIEQAKFDFKVEAGISDIGDVDKTIAAVGGLMEAQGMMAEEIKKGLSEASQLGDAFEKASKEFEADLPRIWAGLSDGVKQELGGVMGGGKLDRGALAQKSQEVEQELAKVNASLKKSEKLLDFPMAEIGTQISKLDSDVVKTGIEIELANKSLEGVVGDEKKTAEIKKDISELTKKQVRLEGESVDKSSKLKELIRGVVEDEEERNFLYESLVNGVTRQGASGRKLQENLRKVFNLTKEQASAMKERLAAEGKLNRLSEVQAVLVSAGAESQKAQIAELETVEALENRRIDLNKNAIAQIKAIGGWESSALKDMRQNQEILEAERDVAQLSGDALEGFLAASRGQFATAEQQLKDSRAAVAKLEGERAALQASLEGTAGEAREAIEANLQATDDAIGEQKQKGAEAARNVKELMTGFIGSAVDAAMEGMEGRRITEQLGLAEALMDSAEFSEDMGKTTKKAFKTMADAARAQTTLMVNAAEQAFADAMAAAATSAEGMAPKEAKKFLEETTITAEAEKRKKIEEAITEESKKVFDAAKQVAELEQRGIDSSMELFEAQADFLSDMGGSLSSMLDIQNKMVQLERDRLTSMVKQYDQAKSDGKDSLILDEMSRKIQIQKLAIQRKELGVQKDMFEKIIGAAFGEIRESVGARKGRMTTMGLAGLERRVMTRSGVLAKAKPGEVKTPKQRELERKGFRNGAIFGIGGGNGGELVPGLNKAPKRLEQEKQMAAGRGAKEEEKKVDAAERAAKVEERKEKDAQKGADVQRQVAKQEEAAQRAEAGKRAGEERAAHAVEMGAAAPGGGVAEMPALKIEGEMTVKFDNAAFKNQIVNVVGEAINTAEVRKALERGGFLNKNT